MDPCRQIGRRDSENGSDVHGRTAAEAVTAAGKLVVMVMLMKRRLSVMVGMLFGAGLVLRVIQMKRTWALPLTRASESRRTRQRKGRDCFTVRPRNSGVFELFANPA